MLKALNLPASEFTPDAQAYIQAGGADALVVWAPQWSKLEPIKDRIDGSQLLASGVMISWAKARKLKVLLAVPCAYPEWTAKPGCAPDDRSPTGGWAAYLELLFKAFPGVLPIVLNEPDLAFNRDRWAGLHVAQMMRTAAKVAQKCGIPHILAPAATNAAFARRVLHWLPAWKPAVDVGWAHHHYTDVDAGSTDDLQAVLKALKRAWWKPGKRVWLTEGGYIYKTRGTPNAEYPVDPGNWSYIDPLQAQEQKQLANVLNHYRACQTLSDGTVECWAGYEYVDSLWGGWASGMVAHDGTKHPLHDAWLKL